MIVLSIIIPTRNRATLLQLALQSLQTQTLSTDYFEVLVIDNGSTDNTKQIVAAYQQKLGNVRYFFDPTPGLHVGRHLGMKMAKSDILVYADDDIEAFPTWLEGIAESFQDQEVALVGGKNLPKFESDPPDWILKMWNKDKNGNRIIGYLSILDLGDSKKAITPYHVFGCNFSIRKSTLLAAHGFHPDAMPQELIQYRGDGETHVSRSIEKEALKTFYNPRASIYHAVTGDRMTLAYFYKRAYNEGISCSFNEFRHKHNAQLLKAVPKGYLYTNKVITWIGRTRIGKILSMIKKRMQMNLSGDRDLAQINWQLDQAWLKGWAYHRKAMKINPELRSYVLKEHYID